MQHYNEEGHINVGTGEDLTILELAHLVRDIVHPSAAVKFDTTKPDGSPRKLLDVTRLHGLEWRHKFELKAGIEHTYRWFLEHADERRLESTPTASAGVGVLDKRSGT
jgi:GDP-L-fucose synthase